MSSIFRVLKPVFIVSFFLLLIAGMSRSSIAMNVDEMIAMQESSDKSTTKPNVENNNVAVPAAQSEEKTKADFELSFSEMMKDPANIDNTMKYANLAIELKNYEAAIPALERILLFNPKLVTVKKNLGVLYFNLEAYDIAKTYFEDAKKDSDASPEIINASTEYLQKIKTAKKN